MAFLHQWAACSRRLLTLPAIWLFYCRHSHPAMILTTARYGAVLCGKCSKGRVTEAYLQFVRRRTRLLSFRPMVMGTGWFAQWIPSLVTACRMAADCRAMG